MIISLVSGTSSLLPNLLPSGAQLVAIAFGCLVTAPVMLFLFLYVLPLSHNNSKRVAVLVLGDIGRSPRMQNHATALAKGGWDVDLIGFKGNCCLRTGDTDGRRRALFGCVGIEGQN